MKDEETQVIEMDYSKLESRIQRLHEKAALRHGTRDSIKLRKYKLGELYVGHRLGSPGHLRAGVLVNAYVTLNWIYRNPAYVLKCLEDGKERVYQGIKPIKFSQIKEIQREREQYLEQLKYAKQDAKEQAIQNGKK